MTSWLKVEYPVNMIGKHCKKIQNIINLKTPICFGALVWFLEKGTIEYREMSL